MTSHEWAAGALVAAAVSNVAGPVMLAFAMIVVAWGTRNAATLLLATTLAVYGVSQTTLAVTIFTESEFLSYNLHTYSSAARIAMIFVYLAFLGVALASPLTRPFRAGGARAALLTIAVLSAATPFVWPTAFADGPAHVSPRIGGVHFFATWAATVADVAFLAVVTYSLVATLDALRRAAAGSPARRRARAYAWAFGVHDAGLIAAFLVVAIIRFGVEVPRDVAFYAVWLVRPLGLIVAVGLMARALLKFQLFDFDLRVKWTLSKGTVAAVFIAVFFVVSEGAQAVFAARWGPLLGLAAAGLLVFALAPLQRLADRVADRALPRVEPTPAYVQFKKMEVYHAAVESAIEEGGITERERRTLDRLRAKLGIAPEDAAHVERDATTRVRAASATG